MSFGNIFYMYREKIKFSRAVVAHILDCAGALTILVMIMQEVRRNGVLPFL